MLKFKCVFSLLCVSIITLTLSGQHKDSIYTFKKASTGGTGKFYLGRQTAQVMSFDGAAWLERSTRQKEENADLAISKLPITANSVIADIGAGTGYYTFRISTKVPQGKVYAVEIQDDAVNYLKYRSQKLKPNNVIVIKGGDHSPNLPVNAIDLAIMVDVYHELLYPHEMLQAIREALKPKGRLLLLEYRAEDPEVPIKELHKMSIKQVNKEMTANGFHLVEDGEFMPIQHFLVYQKD
ncbi:class I SAM-dependent methyltransferase [Mucilaginibacter psychrotolerans]|uniref:Class I SAM-dependent methyltransferase n=1 Tax=Mucilaginibacter psychrotolerans TaxID=1524096 RepID=A0A4Y8SMP4_9SPHI|nr:class I SAM-dependent methyltransferase [Mucilaginibacter psychrotolerans]TFF39797.1 class I SAM-dependent methyltransferase [Mucilaginibacter psychrotolerans]